MKVINFIQSIMWGICLLAFGVVVFVQHYNVDNWSRVFGLIFGAIMILIGLLAVPIELMQAKSERRLYESLNDVGKRLVDSGVPLRSSITAQSIVREEAWKLFEKWEARREERERLIQEQAKNGELMELTRD